MRLLLTACCAFCFVSGCSTANSAASTVSISEVAGEVVDHLENAGTLDAHDAQKEWAMAHDLFQRQLEPTLRHNLPAKRILSIEYRFGRLGAVLGDSAAEEEARLLGAEVASGAASIQGKGH